MIKKVACSRQLPYITFVTPTFMSIIIPMSINPFGLSLSCGRSVVFSGFPVSSTNKTDHYGITEILLKVALCTITLTPFILLWTNRVKMGFDFLNQTQAGPSICIFSLCFLNAQQLVFHAYLGWEQAQQFIYIVHVLCFVIHINNGKSVERTVDCHLKRMESWIATEEIQTCLNSRIQRLWLRYSVYLDYNVLPRWTRTDPCWTPLTSLSEIHCKIRRR